MGINLFSSIPAMDFCLNMHAKKECKLSAAILSTPHLLSIKNTNLVRQNKTN